MEGRPIDISLGGMRNIDKKFAFLFRSLKSGDKGW